MWVTVFTDASWYQSKGIGGWGAWLKCDAGQREQHGFLTHPISSSMQAATAACVAGITLAVRWWPEATGVHVVTDCRDAIRALEWHSKKKHRERVVAALRDVTYTELLEGRKLKLRWVKGHAGGHEPRSWVNERVDTLAAQGRKTGGRRTQGESDLPLVVREALGAAVSRAPVARPSLLQRLRGCA